MAKSTSLTSFIGGANLPALTGGALADALDDVTSGAGSQGGGVYLSFSGKSGKYAMGRGKDDVDPDAVFLVEPTSIKRGFTCWKGSKAIDKVEWYATEARTKAVAEEDLKDHSPYKTSMGEGWKPMLGFGIISCDNLHQSISFTSTSASGVNAIRDLVTEMGTRARSGEPELPLISFDAEEFVAQEQKNWKPKFIVQSWTDRKSFAAYMEGELSLDDLIDGASPKAKPKAVAGKKPAAKNGRR